MDRIRICNAKSASHIDPVIHSMLTRYRQYLRERFPLGRYGLLVASFASSGISLSYLLCRQSMNVGSIAVFDLIVMFSVAFIVVLLSFFQLRVADEHKDASGDAAIFPDRPVPRGLVALAELRVMAILSAVVQFLLVSILCKALVFPLIALWLYMALMSKEFFLADFLKEKPALYMVSHMLVLFFTDFFITSCHWLVAGVRPPESLLLFFCVSFFLGMSIEVSRKLDRPDICGSAPDSYHLAWGRTGASLVLLFSLSLSGIFALAIIHMASSAFALSTMLLSAFVFLLLASRIVPALWRFSRCDNGDASLEIARYIERDTGLWVVATYLLVGPLPLLLELILR